MNTQKDEPTKAIAFNSTDFNLFLIFWLSTTQCRGLQSNLAEDNFAAHTAGMMTDSQHTALQDFQLPLPVHAGT